MTSRAVDSDADSVPRDEAHDVHVILCAGCGVPRTCSGSPCLGEAWRCDLCAEAGTS
jgi:hypothetical protein